MHQDPSGAVSAGGPAPGEPPAASQKELGAASVDLVSLVHHREAVSSDLRLEQVQQRFRSTTVEYLAVEREGRVIGMCSRGHVGFVMGSRFGFAIYSKDSIETVMVPRPLIITREMPLREVLESALLRKSDEFIDDVVLVDEENHLLGLIKVEVLAHLQSRLVAEQLKELQTQHETLRRQNLELFKANNAARQSKGLYLGLFASHTLGVALLDEHGAVHEYNARLAELLNLSDTTAVVASLSKWIVESERKGFLALLEAHARGRAAPDNHEFTFDIPGRGRRIVRCSMGWISETGEVCACLDDVTEQRALEQNLLKREKQKLLDTLVGGIAHELNNKLAPIMGFSELLRDEASGGSSEYVSLIIKSVEEAARIIRQLLELSKPSSQSVRPLDLRTVVEETLALLQFKLRETRCDVQTFLPSKPVTIMGDAGQLKQVALNLIINALHAMEGQQTPVLTVQVRIDGSTAELVVSDNGCGIEPANLSRIFDPFFTTKGPEHGTGLGLSVCYSVVRQHGGDIKVESEPGVGTRFTVSLRLEPAMALLLDMDKPSSAFLMPLPPIGTRVLIVEDEIVLRRLLQEIICSRFGCRVEMVSNGAEALKALETGSFALVLADIRMPVMSGTELYLRLKDSRPDMAQRFVFVTGHANDKQLEAEIAKWNVPVVAKPFTLARLAEVCGPFLQDKKLVKTCA
jgi:two-component system NtrC family sensor kinase